MATKKTVSPRASKVLTFDVHAAIYRAESAMISGEQSRASAFEALCKEAEKALRDLPDAKAIDAFKAEMKLDIFAARVGLPYGDDTRDKARELQASITLREKPARKAFESDAAFNTALLIFNSYNAAKTRVSEVFGAKGQKHWDKPLAKDDAARETRKRGEPQPGANKTGKTAMPAFANADEAGAWARELAALVMGVQAKNAKTCGADFSRFAQGVAKLAKELPETV